MMVTLIAGLTIFLFSLQAVICAESPNCVGKSFTLLKPSMPEEEFIASYSVKTGAKLKLQVFNKEGRIWTMVAGTGATIAYCDAIVSQGAGEELANYGEYSGMASGAPLKAQTYELAKMILSLMTRGRPRPDGKILILGGGIANFTDVPSTFKGIIKAIKEFKQALIEHNVQVYVRRGGPNYQVGLVMMAELGVCAGIPMHVYGPEMHITGIVALALGSEESTRDTLTQITPIHVPEGYSELNGKSRAFVWESAADAVQEMLKYDLVSGRDMPSVAALISTSCSSRLFQFGEHEYSIPVYSDVAEASEEHSDVDWLIIASKGRAAYESCVKVMETAPKIKNIALIAEDVTDGEAEALRHLSRAKGVNIFGPGTSGAIRAGAFKIAHTGGHLDNILASKLNRPGSVSYVTRSGGMSNELCNLISRSADGVLEGVFIGEARVPSLTLTEHALRYEKDPACRMIVVLGEMGGLEEYSLIEAVKSKEITKPVVAWCLGTCFDSKAKESASAKNRAMKEAGILVPDTFEALPALLNKVFAQLN